MRYVIYLASFAIFLGAILVDSIFAGDPIRDKLIFNEKEEQAPQLSIIRPFEFSKFPDLPDLPESFHPIFPAENNISSCDILLYKTFEFSANWGSDKMINDFLLFMYFKGGGCIPKQLMEHIINTTYKNNGDKKSFILEAENLIHSERMVRFWNPQPLRLNGSFGSLSQDFVILDTAENKKNFKNGFTEFFKNENIKKNYQYLKLINKFLYGEVLVDNVGNCMEGPPCP